MIEGISVPPIILYIIDNLYFTKTFLPLMIYTPFEKGKIFPRWEQIVC